MLIYGYPRRERGHFARFQGGEFVKKTFLKGFFRDPRGCLLKLGQGFEAF